MVRHGARNVDKMWLRCGSKVFETCFIETPLMQTSLSRELSSQGYGLFDTVPKIDYLNFGIGDSFDAKAVPNMLGLKKEDVSRLASVSVRSVRYEQHIPEAVRERLEEIAATANMVAAVFDGNPEKTAAWFRARNPLLGDISPRDMIRLGRYERLRKFIINAMLSQRAANEPQGPEAAVASGNTSQ